MAKSARIRTPWLRELNLFRLQVLPYAWFALCVALTGWLWQRVIPTTAMPRMGGSETLDVSKEKAILETPAARVATTPVGR